MPSDYNRDDEHAVIPRRIKCHFDPSIIIGVATEHGLRAEIVRMPDWKDFCVVKIFATRRDFKVAQFAWLQKMIEARHETEIEL